MPSHGISVGHLECGQQGQSPGFEGTGLAHTVMSESGSKARSSRGLSSLHLCSSRLSHRAELSRGWSGSRLVRPSPGYAAGLPGEKATVL